MQALSGVQKITIAVIALAVLGGSYYFYQSYADTTIGLTLTTNPDLENGLIGWWTFDGADVDWSSTTAEIRDRSLNTNNGNALSTLSSADVVSGVLGQALDFTDDDNRVDLGIQADLQMQTGDLTVGAWMNLSTSSSVGVYNSPGIFGTGAGSDVSEGYAFHYYHPTKQLGFRISNGVTRVNAFSDSNLSIFEGEWVHVVAVADRDGVVQFYVNGISAGSADISSLDGQDISSCCGDNMLLGAWVHDAIYDSMSGKLDDIRIYNRALSADEVKRLYQLGATTKIAQTIDTNPNLENGLLLHWTFDGNQFDWGNSSAEVRDSTGQGNTGNAIGGMGTENVVPGAMGQAMMLDGVDDYVDNTSLDNTNFPVNGSLSLWVYSDFPFHANNMSIFDDYTTTRNTIFIRAYKDNGIHGQIQTALRPNDGSGSVATETTILDLLTWNHIALVWDTTNDQVLYYKNGERYKTDAISSTTWTPSQQNVTLSGSNSLSGYIDDFRIYDRNLSPNEVKRLYQLGATTKIAQTIDTNPDLENGLVGHWTFDGKDMNWSSTTAEVLDVSGQGNHGNATNMTLDAVLPGVLGQGIAFNGTNNYTNHGTSSSLLPGSNNFTASLWFRSQSAVANKAFLSNGTRSANGIGYALILNGTSDCVTGKVIFEIDDNVTKEFVCSDASNYNSGEWHHMVGVRDGNNLRLFMDGREESTSPTDITGYGSISNPLGALTIGSIVNGSTFLPASFLDGSIDDVRIYNRALSAEEIKRLYELGQ